MVTTSVVLFLGLGSMITSSFPPHQIFGGIMAVTMVVALAADLLLLPALLQIFIVRREERPGHLVRAPRAGHATPLARRTS